MNDTLESSHHSHSIVDGGFEHMLMSLVPRPGFERGN